MSKHRKVIVTTAESDVNYCKSLASDYPAISFDQFTHINLIKDKNQTRWLGKELGDTVLIFNAQVNLNGLLCLINAIRGGCYVVFVFVNGGEDTADLQHNEPHKQLPQNFIINHFLPALKAISIKFDSSLCVQENFISNRTEDSSNKSEAFDNALRQMIMATETGFQVVQLIGERGVGKTTLLGQIIRHFTRNNQAVLLCSPSYQASDNALKFLQDVSRETWRFITPDKLCVLDNLTNYDLIVIDEAATMPRALIDSLVKKSQQNPLQLVLCTTISGYESTGQSYRHHYLAHIDQSNNTTSNFIHTEDGGKISTRVIELAVPYRFAADDKLFRLTQRLTGYHEITKITLPDGVHILNQDDMAKNDLIIPSYGLLKEAHYKNSPNDLLRMYDQPALFVFKVLNNTIVSVAYVIIEALQDKDVVKGILKGNRRSKNAFTQQAIIQAYGELAQPYGLIDNKMARIVRIATVSSHRKKGYASQLISALHAYLDKNVMALSVSFSIQSERVDFWCKAGFKPVKIGVKFNKYNNAPAVLMLKPVNLVQAENNLCNQRIARLQHFCLLFIDYYLPYYGQNRMVKAAIQRLMVWQSDGDYTIKRHRVNDHLSKLEQLRLQAEVQSIIHGHRPASYLLPILIDNAKQNVNQNNLIIESALLPFIPFRAMQAKEQTLIKKTLTAFY